MPAIPKLAAPVVLVHGIRGFDQLFRCRRPSPEEFPGVRRYLETAGNVVLVPRVSPTATVATRAAELRAFLRESVGCRPVHLVGHSMGGLDARYLISRLGMHEQVLSLTTVATPHRGTPFADWGLRRLAPFLRPLFRAAGLPEDGFHDLTLGACARFNELVPDAPGVRYQSVAGECRRPWLGPEWAVSARIVGRAEGPNDGVVSVASAAWGGRQEVWTGDHLNVVNWPNRRMRRAGAWRDRAGDYGRLLAHLAEAER